MSMREYSAKQKNHLSEHTKAIHMKEKYQCKLCNLLVSRKSTLFRHVKNIHQTKDKTVCPDCNKSLKQSNFDNHRRTFHSGKGTFYNCNICSFQTIHKASLKLHKKKHQEGIKGLRH